MQIGEVIGTVTLVRSHPLLTGARLKVVVPRSLANLRGASHENQEPIVVYDELGAGHGAQVAISEGREAAQPFDPTGKPIDAYNAALLDQIHLYEQLEL